MCNSLLIFTDELECVARFRSESVKIYEKFLLSRQTMKTSANLFFLEYVKFSHFDRVNSATSVTNKLHYFLTEITRAACKWCEVLKFFPTAFNYFLHIPKQRKRIMCYPENVIAWQLKFQQSLCNVLLVLWAVCLKTRCFLLHCSTVLRSFNINYSRLSFQTARYWPQRRKSER